MHFAIVDIETTGGSPKSSKITEIAIYKHNGKEIIDEYTTLINPEMKIPDFIVRLTGISDKMVGTAPKFFEVARKIIEFTEECVFVAHNVGFDYSIIRQEFKTLGYDYRKPHLCTVRASRSVIPGMESYSLGKLSRNLGIEIKGRHRAGGDALATAHLFTQLIEKDPEKLSTFIQEEINPRILHPNLDLETLEAIPSKTGVYKFYDENNKLIYIGKSKQIKNRIDQHLRNTKTKKGIQMMKEISRIEIDLTGSELIALLKESQLIKQYKPLFNRRLTRTKFPFGIYDELNETGHLKLKIDSTGKRESQPIISFSTRNEAVNYLEKILEEYLLCQKLCGLYPTKSACFHHSIQICNGACIDKEKSIKYNERVQSFIDKHALSGESFYLIDKGRHKSEKSLVLVENGVIAGFGFAPYHFNNQPIFKWKRFIDLTNEDRDARCILNLFMRKNTDVNIVKF